MSRPLQGVRVVEVAGWTFVPAAGAMLADLGADVIKIEPQNGDPQRGLTNLLNLGTDATNPFLEIPNRGKRSVTLDLTHPQGREVLLRLIETADVFLTSYLPALRARMGIEPADLQAVNPKLIYVRGHGWGAKGPKADIGAYDMAAAWSAGGLAYKLTGADADSPPMQPAAFYDLQGASTIAGAVGTALFARERSGTGSVVDVSLLGTALWTMAPDILGAKAAGTVPTVERKTSNNPLSNFYRTGDNRWIALVCLQSDRFWPELMTLAERSDLIADPRFADAGVRFANKVECIATLDAIFATKSLAEWEAILAKFSGVWSPVRSFEELYESEQIDANDMLPEVTRHDGGTYRTPAPAAQFDGEAGAPQGPAPELGQHTEEVLLDAGLDWDAISAYREQGALG
jgi:crotonobetainyl-CoA:carnitine CoA-transferase CaiB-like acyl-CoA transferase